MYFSYFSTAAKKPREPKAVPGRTCRLRANVHTNRERNSEPSSSPVNKHVQLSTEAGAPQPCTTCPRLSAGKGMMVYRVLAQPAPKFAEPLHNIGSTDKTVWALTSGCTQITHQQLGCSNSQKLQAFLRSALLRTAILATPGVLISFKEATALVKIHDCPTTRTTVAATTEHLPASVALTKVHSLRPALSLSVTP